MPLSVIDKIDQLIGLIDSFCNHQHIVNSIPFKSRRAIAAAHLIGKILHDYLNNPSFICPFVNQTDDENTHTDLLNYVLIRGGATRDTILNRAINDLDCIVDIHSSIKFHLNHLKKYHSLKKQQSKHCKCILWQYYLNKYKSNNNNNILTKYMKDLTKIKEKHKQEFTDRFFSIEHKIILSEYLLNTRFFMKILLNSQILCDKLKIKNFFFNHNWTIQINESLIYHNIDLNGAELDLVDNTGKLGAMKELEIELKTNDIDNDNKVIDIRMPLYPLSYKDVNLFFDFTLNTMLISFKDVVSPCIDSIDFNWVYKIYSNRFHEHNADGIKDINNKILVAPSLKIINNQTANFYFWRLMKVATKFIDEIEKKEWKIDAELIKHTLKGYDIWFTNDFINNNELRWIQLIYKYFEWGVRDNRDFEDRLKLFKILKFDLKLIPIINSHGKFRKHWRYGINRQDNSTKQLLYNLFPKYGYTEIKPSLNKKK